MDAAGKNIADLDSHIARNIDAKASGDIQQQIALAEELGSTATMAGAAGVGGSSVDVYNGTVRLRAALQREEGDRAFASDIYGANQAKGEMLYSAVAGLDNNVYRANLDYRRWADPHKQTMLSKIAEVGLTAAATYFGGPQAGQAVMGVFDSMEQAQNGDFAGAASTFNNAASAGISAYQTTRSMGGGSYWSKPSAGVPQIGGGGGGGNLWGSSGSPFSFSQSYTPFTIR